MERADAKVAAGGFGDIAWTDAIDARDDLARALATLAADPATRFAQLLQTGLAEVLV